MMQYRKTIATVCIATGTVLAAHTLAHACSCRGGTRAFAIKSSDVVFQGRVTAVHTDQHSRYASITVIRPIKGNVRTRVEVSTRRSSAACGYPFKQGQTLIIGAKLHELQYRTSMCIMFTLNKSRR